MTRRIWAIVTICVLGSSTRGIADFIDFGNNPINFTPPALTSGDGSITSSDPTLVPLTDGFSVEDLSYTVTSTSTGEIDGGFSADRDFSLITDPLTKYRLMGSTNVTQTGANSSVELLITAVIDGKEIETRGIGVVNGAVVNKEVKWDFTIQVDVAAGPHKLEQKASYAFTPGAVNDKVTVSSQYQITASTVPEPSSVFLAGLGVLILGMSERVARSRNARARRVAEAKSP